jgi:dipeptidyl aminopeptidase/acylaminoacyl peptidase
MFSTRLKGDSFSHSSRFPVINSEQLYMALKRLGKTAELVVYPGEFHGIGTPSYIKDLYTRG